MSPLARQLEALLFAAGAAVKVDALAAVTEATPDAIRDALRELADHVNHEDGLLLEEVAGGWRLVTQQQYGLTISQLLGWQTPTLSRAALETLAVVAAKQPITRAELERIRGVNSEHSLRTLLEFALIEERGRKEAPGRPWLYGTTRQFLEHFGLQGNEEIAAMLRQGEGSWQRNGS